jgi:hypothetical protein
MWTLFLAVRSESSLTDLVPGFFLLIASIHAVFKGRPSSFTDSMVFPEPRDGSPSDGAEKEGPDDTQGLLANLCQSYCSTQLKKVEAARDTVNRLLDALISKGEIEGEAGVDGRGIAHDDRLDRSLEALSALVERWQAPHGLGGSSLEVDGLIFLERPDLVGSPHDTPRHKRKPPTAPSTPSRPTKLPRSPLHPTATPPRRGVALAPPKTPEQGISLHQGRAVTLRQGESTPMRGVMRDVRWLSLYLRDEDCQPDDALRVYFAACDTDVTPGILARIEQLPQVTRPDMVLLGACGRVSALGSRAGSCRVVGKLLLPQPHIKAS